MVLQPIMLSVSADQLNVLLVPVSIAIKLLVCVVLYLHAVKKMVLKPTVLLPVSVGQPNVLLIPVIIAIHLSILVIKYHAIIHKVLQKILSRVGVIQQIVLPITSVINRLVLVTMHHCAA